MHSHGNTYGKRLAVLARVSTEDQEQYGTSLDEQVDRCRKLGEALSYTIAPEHIYRGDESGRLPLDERSIIQRVLAAARAREFDAVVFYKLDRMARRLKFILELWDKLDELGIAVLIVDPLIDTSTPVGRLIRNVLASVAEFEVDTLLERSMAGKRRKAQRGEAMPPGRKYGYTYTRLDPATHTPGHHTINEEQACMVRRMFERRAAGATSERIAKELTADGVTSPSGEGPWWGRTVENITRDPAYKGDGKWGRRETVRLANGKRSLRLRRDSSGIISVPFPAIVSPELWDAANHIESRGGRHPVRTTPDKFLLYGGMVRCAEHNRVMTGSASERPNPRYQCKRHKPTGGFECHQVPAVLLDKMVWEAVTDLLGDSERLAASLREQRAKLEADRARAGERRREVVRDLAKVGEDLRYMLRVARETRLEPTLLEQEMAELETKASRLRRELQTLTAQEQVAETDLQEEDRIAHMCFQVADEALNYTPQQKRAMLELLRLQVTVHGDEYSIEGLLDGTRLVDSLGMHTENTSTHASSVHPLRFCLTGKLVA